MTEPTPQQQLDAIGAALRGPEPSGKPATSREAADKLNSLTSNKEWAARFTKGDREATSEFQELTQLAAQGDGTAALAIEVVDAVSDPSAMTRAGFNALLDGLREGGTPENMIEAYLKGEKAPAAIYRQVEQWKNQRMRDGAWQKKFLANDSEARKQMAVANMILSAGPGEEGKPA